MLKFNMENFKRPLPKETDEDLLKEQELFFKNKETPSVQIKTKNPDGNNNSNSRENEKQNEEKLIVPEEEVLLDVQEHSFPIEKFVFQLPSVSLDEAFNLLSKEEEIFQISQKRKEKSIFVESMEKDKVSKISLNSSEIGAFKSLINGSGLENGLDDVRKIHKENQVKLGAMTKEEIQNYQAQLKKSLDASVVQFIQSKRKSKKQNIETEKNFSSLYKSKKVNNSYNMPSLKAPENIEILKKEGKNDCDALLLEKAFNQESSEGYYRSVNNKDIYKTEMFELPETTKKLIEESKKGKWEHMNKVEKDKLEWLSELPKPNPINLKTGYTARFDFEGKLLSPEIDIPTHKGLHHHGKEPEIAGYSLEELFLLARSSLQSQRITALHTLAHILDNYWFGMLDCCFDSPLLPTLLDAGIVPLLRWALDDTSVMSVAATVTVIHSLLICKADEACLHKTFPWLNGHLLPLVEPVGLEEANVAIEEMSDADLIKLDVIKGFLRVDILPRFQYILQVMQPSPLVCKLIIEILAHLAQHSFDSSNQIAKYPGLLDLIFKKFLPVSWCFIDNAKLTDTVNYCCPLPSAMKLIRITASLNKELALLMSETYALEQVLSVYLTLNPTDEKLALYDVQNIMVESLKTLYIYLCYDFSFQVFLDLYPIFLRQMDYIISLSMKMEEAKHCKDFEYASHFFKVIEAVVLVSAEKDRIEVETLLDAIFQKSLLCLKKWFHEMKHEQPSDLALNLLSASLNYVSIYYQKTHTGLTCDNWEPCAAVKDMYANYLIPSIKSEVFKSMLKQIQSFSLLLCTDQSGNKRDGKTLVSLGSVLWEGDVVPPLKNGTLIPLMLSISNFMYVYKSLFEDGDNQGIDELLKNISIGEYLKNVRTKKLNYCSWFGRFEVQLIVLLLKLYHLAYQSDSFEWHQVSASLLPILKETDKCVVKDLFKTTIFNETFLPISSKEDILDIKSVLPVIADCYITYFIAKAKHSHSKSHNNIEFSDSLSSLSNPRCLLPKDWCYAPIFDLYHQSSQKETSDALSPETLLLVTSCLQWIFVCRELKLSLLSDSSGSTEYCYLSMTFILDGDCFRCPKIYSLLEKNLLSLLKKKKLNFSKVDSENISNFNDLYMELLNQFEAVSYGDYLFGNYLLVPLQQCHSKQWKKLLLTDHSDALAFLKIPLTKLLVPIQNYLVPYEIDEEILKEYLILLKNGCLSYQRCPLLYLMAVHHLNHFIFSRNIEYKALQKSLVLNVTTSKNKVLMHHILLYSESQIESEIGFTLKEQLSSKNVQHLSDILGKPVTL